TWKHSIGFIISVIVLLFIFELSDAMFLKGLCIVETLVSLWQLIVVSQKYFLRLTIASKTVKSGVSGKIDYINKVFNALNEAIEQNNKK
ncbi:MAG: hypothetical protein LBM68_04750, partial [Bacteroidales bacterium]|nr:hypothetical protein [Bacteroidales bacterium]